MKIKWYGHACFELESNGRVKMVADPYDGSIGYSLPRLNADIVTVSHDHYDHNNVSTIDGNFELVNEVGIHEIKGITIEGIPTFHDDSMGSKRGKNIVFKYAIDDMIICHLGDLGHMLDNEQLGKLKNVDVLLIPIGGTYTIDSKQAAELVKKISPKIIIPMHYRTKNLKMNLEPVENFIREVGAAYFTENNVMKVEKETLGQESRVIVMEY